MRLRTPLLTFAAFALAVCAGARAQEQQQDQQVIDDFVNTRGVSFDGPDKKTQKKAAPAPRKNAAAGKSPSGGVASSKGGGKGSAAGKSNKPTPQTGGGGAEPSAQSGGAGVDGATVLQAGAQALGLGYTILLRDDAGALYVADAAREFRTREQFAVALEPNADGYLYLFSAENGSNPELLFPDARIEGGANAVQAHARATFPTGEDADEKYFVTFEDPPATEHLYVVLSRRPLADVPAGEALVKFCEKNRKDCAWKPTAAQWARILASAKGRRVIEARNTELLAQAGSQPAVPATLQRGLKVKREDPKPAVVRVNASPDADVLVTEIVLVHK